MWEIEPYASVGPIRFGMSGDELVGAVGTPNLIDQNHRGESDYEYSGFSVRLSKSEKKVVEAGVQPRVPVSLSGIEVFSSPTAFDDLIKLDGDPLESLGFIVLMRLGVTLTGFHDNDPDQKALTAFARGRWDEVRSRLRKYEPTRSTGGDQPQ